MTFPERQFFECSGWVITIKHVVTSKETALEKIEIYLFKLNCKLWKIILQSPTFLRNCTFRLEVKLESRSYEITRGVRLMFTFDYGEDKSHFRFKVRMNSFPKHNEDSLIYDFSFTWNFTVIELQVVRLLILSWNWFLIDIKMHERLKCLVNRPYLPFTTFSTKQNVFISFKRRCHNRIKSCYESSG